MQPQIKKRFPTIIIIIASLLALCIICIASSFAMDAMGLLPTNTPSASTTPPSIQLPTQQNTQETENSRCVRASSQQIEAIRIGIKDIEQSNDITDNVWAVKSKDFESVWFVAAEISGPSIEPKQAIGVWAISGDMETLGLILSVDGFAKEFSSYPDGATTKAATSMSDDGAQESKSCAINN